MKLRVTSRARRHALHADRWWRENRPSAPDLFLDELTTAFERLELSPESGIAFPDTEVPDVRRTLLRETRYHIYYVVNTASNEVIVLAIWGAVRGRAPQL